MSTIYLRTGDIKRAWHLIDAKDIPLGRLASHVATLLRGKHRPYYAPHQEMGDYVVIINAAHVHVSGRKMRDKIYYRHSGYLGSLKQQNLETVMRSKPIFPLEHAIRGMLPKNRLGRKLFHNVKIYPDAAHPHSAQSPVPYRVDSSAQKVRI